MASSNNTLPYLQKLRKNALIDVAQSTGLEDYDQLNKPDLVVILDKHLRQYQDDYHEDPKLEEYYKRLSLPTSPTRSTPTVKREREIKEIKVEPTPRATATPDRDTNTRELRASTVTTRRRRRWLEESEPSEEQQEREPDTPSDDNGASTGSGAQLFPPVTLSPSLAAATGNVDRPTSWLRKRVYDSFSASRLLRWLNAMRWWLSDLKVIQALIVTVEASWIIFHLLPSRTPTSFQDFLNLTSGSLWAPLSLWVLTNVLVPLALAFFCNASKATVLQTNRSRAYPARSSRASGRSSGAAEAESDFDYLTFCIARGLLSYIIYGNKVTVLGLFNRSPILKVNAAAPGKWVGMVIASGIGGVEAIYQTILRRIS